MTLLNKAIIILSLLVLSSRSVFASEATLKFVPNAVEAQINTPFTISVMVDTAGFSSGGVGTIIEFDPFMISATAIQTGKIFTDYPMSTINNQRGKISISGIASSTDHLFSGSGEFAKITFKPNQPGYSTILFSFQPGSTTDSNIAVTFGNGDVLTKVNQLNINITSNTSTVTKTPSNNLITSLKSISYSSLKEQLDAGIALLHLPFVSSKYASARTGRPISKNLDPLAPIVAQPPITDPSTNQPPASINNISSNSHFFLYLIIVILFIVILSLTIALVRISKTKTTNFTA